MHTHRLTRFCLAHFRYTYELTVVSGIHLNESSTPLIKQTYSRPPVSISLDDLGGENAAGKIFTMTVRLRSPHVSIQLTFQCQSETKGLVRLANLTNFRFAFKGYYSPVYEIEHIEVQPDAWLYKMLPTKSSSWMIIIPMMLILAIGGGVFYTMRRNRRLNTFSRFTNSHYDTKTGTTRIGDEDDHHHNDNINDLPRFDDDEPLVLT